MGADGSSASFGIFSRRLFPAVFGTSGVASAGIGPWLWLEGPEGGQLTAVISPCCSLSAAQALLHCKDIAARQLGRVGENSARGVSHSLERLNPPVLAPEVSETGLEKVINYNLSIIPLNKKEV